MSDVFFSYSSSDRGRVKAFHEAFSAAGFQVFWDLEVPLGIDWDSWIRQHLVDARVVLVFWSRTAVVSRNVRHEVVIAQELGKLVPVLLEPLSSHEFPMGLYTVEAADLSRWTGTTDDVEWISLLRHVERRATPRWVELRMTELEYRTRAEIERRQAAELALSELRADFEKSTRQQASLIQAQELSLAETRAESEKKLSEQADLIQARELSLSEARAGYETKLGEQADLIQAHELSISVIRDEYERNARKHAEMVQAHRRLNDEMDRISERLGQEVKRRGELEAFVAAGWPSSVAEKAPWEQPAETQYHADLASKSKATRAFDTNVEFLRRAIRNFKLRRDGHPGTVDESRT